MKLDTDEGVHPALSALVDVEVQPQVKHSPKRGSRAGACGSYEGQIAWGGIGVTCIECLRLRRRK